MIKVDNLLDQMIVQKVTDINSDEEILINTKTPGWNYKETLICYGLLSKKLKENAVVVEVGTGLGTSIWSIALNAPLSTRIYAIDAWLGTDVNLNNSIYYKNYVPGLKNSEENFLKYTNGINNVTAIKAHSPKDSAIFDQIPKADLVILDVDHLYHEWFDNIIFWSKRLTDNGVIAGNDYILEYDGRDEYVVIKNAIDDAAKYLNKKLELVPAAMFWIMKN